MFNRNLQRSVNPLVNVGATTVTAIVGDGAVTLNWTAATNATGYLVGRDGTDSLGSGPWQTVDPSNSRSRVFDNLVNGTTYTLFCTPQPGGVQKSIQVTPQAATPSTAMPTGAAASIESWTLVFEDDFDGTSIDTTKWIVSNNTQRNDLTTVASNVSVTNSEVRLQLSDATHGSEITTGYGWDSNQKYALPVGGFTEARVWFPGPTGGGYYNWSAWWTTGDPWPNAGEHDIAEVLGSQLTAGNYHYGTDWQTDHHANNGPAPAGTWRNGWHIYGLYLGPVNATVYWDGVAVRTYARSDTGTPQTLILNAGSGGSAFMAGLPGALRCDWVRAWEPAA